MKLRKGEKKKSGIITSDGLTDSSTCMLFRISTTFVEALPLALTFGIIPKDN